MYVSNQSTIPFSKNLESVNIYMRYIRFDEQRIKQHAQHCPSSPQSSSRDWREIIQYRCAIMKPRMRYISLLEPAELTEPFDTTANVWQPFKVVTVHQLYLTTSCPNLGSRYVKLDSVLFKTPRSAE